MLGYLTLSDRPERKLVEEELLGMPVLRGSLSPGDGGWKRRRRRKTARALCARGVRRVLTARDFPFRQELAGWGLSGVGYAPLCRAMAVPLTLQWLAVRGVDPGEAVVELRGRWISHALFRTAEGLCPRVRGLLVSAPGEAGSVTGYLRREYGLAQIEGVRPTVTVSFSPWGEGRSHLSLYGEEPCLGGLTLELRRGELPREADPLPLLEALWEGGAVTTGDLRVTRKED